MANQELEFEPDDSDLEDFDTRNSRSKCRSTNRQRSRTHTPYDDAAYTPSPAARSRAPPNGYPYAPAPTQMAGTPQYQDSYSLTNAVEYMPTTFEQDDLASHYYQQSVQQQHSWGPLPNVYPCPEAFFPQLPMDQYQSQLSSTSGLMAQQAAQLQIPDMKAQQQHQHTSAVMREMHTKQQPPPAGIAGRDTTPVYEEQPYSMLNLDPSSQQFNGLPNLQDTVALDENGQPSLAEFSLDQLPLFPDDQLQLPLGNDNTKAWQIEDCPDGGDWQALLDPALGLPSEGL